MWIVPPVPKAITAGRARRAAPSPRPCRAPVSPPRGAGMPLASRRTGARLGLRPAASRPSHTTEATMELGLAGKVAIITGASQGIGRATAVRLAAEGARVAICARGQDALERLAVEIRDAGGEALPVVADVSKPEDLARLVGATVHAFGGVDILVNNAGTSATGRFESIADEAWQADLDLKLFAAIRLIRLAVPLMCQRGGGRIVNVTNIGAKAPPARSMPTTVSRAAGQAMTKALSKELAPDGILVNTVCIGLVRAGQHEGHARRAGLALED